MLYLSKNINCDTMWWSGYGVNTLKISAVAGSHDLVVNREKERAFNSTVPGGANYIKNSIAPDKVLLNKIFQNYIQNGF